MKVAIIGGGPAGLMAAHQARLNGHEVAILESQDRVGKKLLMTGNGRCNITNNKDVHEFISLCSKSTRFLYGSLTEFGPHEIIDFFHNQNCPLVEEKEGRMYPQTQKAQSILDALLDKKIKIMTNVKVIDLMIKNNKIQTIVTTQGDFDFDHIVVATGGKSFPVTGSDGSGYKLLERCGHTITKLFGVETGLLSPNLDSLQGISLTNVTINVLVNNKVKATTTGDLLFTHFGLSGPGILKLSESVVNHLKNKPQIQIHCPTINLEKGDLAKKLRRVCPRRFVDFLLKGIDLKPLEQTSNQAKEDIRNNLLKPTFDITGVQPIEKAFVTKGGVKTNEFDPQTMKSKLIENLSVCGEVLDCHGPLGGYNLTLALSSGYTAGKKL